jgi:hypothetical protein
MQPLDLIRTTHEIDRHLADISAAVSDDDLKKDLVAFNARWRELGYRVTADLCGMASAREVPTPKRRGRRRRIDAADVATGAQDGSVGAGS